MPGTIHPGHLGNLTQDEQAKLQETWRRLSKICGMGLEDALEEDDSPVGATVTEGGETAKNSRRARFGRKKTDAVNKDKAAADDKYGQTKQFQQALKENSPEDIRKALWANIKADHPDAVLLRFLRARKWDVDKALVMMISALNWRTRDMHVEEKILRQGEGVAFKEKLTKDDEGFLHQFRIGKSFMHGVDKEGRPLFIVRSKLHIPGQDSEKSLEDFTVHMIETARLTLREPVDTATLVFDMTDFSLKNMENAPVRFMIKCFEANYPECLGIVAVHNAPWIFQGIWKIIRGWLDPVVAAKIHFTNNLSDLAQHIPKQNILKDLGGGDDFTFKYEEPKPGENDRLADTATREKLEAKHWTLFEEYEAATSDWLQHPPSDSRFADTMAKRNEVAEKIRIHYWQLDPYIRARTVYDRTGVINEGGRIDFYPYRTDKTGVSEQSQINGTA